MKVTEKARRTEYLASHGYIVQAPDHRYNTLWDYDESQMASSAIERPKDVSFIIDMFFELSDSNDEYLSKGYSTGFQVEFMQKYILIVLVHWIDFR